jgi:imidazoleglycerol phosphate synthase glutamine amidotransferase subunit HisH
VTTVAIARYGAGNVRSVELALRRLDAELVDDLRAADLVVLPGVGSARSAMDGLGEAVDVLRKRHAAGRPILGICLGAQIALDESEEDGGTPCLGLVPGRAVRLRAERVPRIGWAPVEPPPASPATPGSTGRATAAWPPWLPATPETYWFAHSYACETDAVIARSEGHAAIIESGAFTGVQFHPEKSGPAGARFLRNLLLSRPSDGGFAAVASSL